MWETENIKDDVCVEREISTQLCRKDFTVQQTAYIKAFYTGLRV